MYPIKVANRRINADQIESVDEISRGLRLHMASGEMILVAAPDEVQAVKDVFDKHFTTLTAVQAITAPLVSMEEVPASETPKTRKAKAHD